MKSVEGEAEKIPRIFIAAQAFHRLKLYITLCPFEVGGLGTVQPFGEDLLVADIFLIRQRATHAETELESQAVADHLLQTLREGGDLSTLRLWWHSHAEGAIYWSDTDEKTIEAFHIDPLVSIVGNKRHEFGCRLDRFAPRRVTLDRLPLLPVRGDAPEDDESLRKQILAELREKVTLIWREVPTVPELFFTPSSTLEISIPFDEQDPPR